MNIYKGIMDKFTENVKSPLDKKKPLKKTKSKKVTNPSKTSTKF
jgi:hypothetical protein